MFVSLNTEPALDAIRARCGSNSLAYAELLGCFTAWVSFGLNAEQIQARMDEIAEGK